MKGPESSMSFGGLMTCTCPQKWPVLLPRSRNQRPPGQASILKGKGLPSGISLSGPSWARTHSKAISMGASMKISFWIFIEEISPPICTSGDSVVMRLMGILLFLCFFYSFAGFSFGTFFNAIELVNPEFFVHFGPVVNGFKALAVNAVKALAAFLAHGDE